MFGFKKKKVIEEQEIEVKKCVVPRKIYSNLSAVCDSGLCDCGNTVKVVHKYCDTCGAKLFW